MYFLSFFVYKYKEVFKRSISWAKRSLKAYIKRKGYGIFGIIQGGMFKDLRTKSIKENLENDFDGYAIGGLAVGEGHDLMIEYNFFCTKYLPLKKAQIFNGCRLSKRYIGSCKKWCRYV